MAQEAVVSRVVQHQKSARWRIEGAHCLSLKPNERIRSGALFEIPGGISFSLKLYMGGHSFQAEDIGLFAECHGFELCKKGLTWEPQVACVNQVDESKNWIVAKKQAEEVSAADTKWSSIGWKQFIPRTKLERDGFIVNDTLVFELRVKVWFPELQHSRLSAGSAAEPLAAAAVAFSDDIASLLTSAEGSDISLRAGVQNGDETSAEPLRAHRLLLAARSPVFRQMFFGTTGMAETASCGEVCLSDMDRPTASLFLAFLYAGKLDPTTWEDEDAVCHLLLAGHKYEVKSLVEACVSHLVTGLNEENAAERLMMSDMLGISQIRDATLEYMCASSERLAVIQGTEAFGRLGQQRPQLALQIMAKMIVPVRKRPAESHSLPADLSCKTVVQLKQLCSDRGLPTSGNKQALIDRLKASST